MFCCALRRSVRTQKLQWSHVLWKPSFVKKLALLALETNSQIKIHARFFTCPCDEVFFIKLRIFLVWSTTPKTPKVSCNHVYQNLRLDLHMHGLRPAVRHKQRRFVSTLRVTKHNARPQQCQTHLWRTKRSGKSGAKYWFRNNVSVELLAVAFALVRTWAKYSATTEFWQSKLGSHESSCNKKVFFTTPLTRTTEIFVYVQIYVTIISSYAWSSACTIFFKKWKFSPVWLSQVVLQSTVREATIFVKSVREEQTNIAPMIWFPKLKCFLNLQQKIEFAN